MRLRKILPALNVIRSTKESLIYELTWEVSIQKKPHTSANSVKSLSIIPIPLHLTSEFILARMWEIKSIFWEHFWKPLHRNWNSEMFRRLVQEYLEKNIWIPEQKCSKYGHNNATNSEIKNYSKVYIICFNCLVFEVEIISDRFWPNVWFWYSDHIFIL